MDAATSRGPPDRRLVVVLFAIAGVLAWVGWMRRLGFWHFLGTPSAPLGPSCAELSYRGGSLRRPISAAIPGMEYGLRAPRRQVVSTSLKNDRRNAHRGRRLK